MIAEALKACEQLRLLGLVLVRRKVPLGVEQAELSDDLRRVRGHITNGFIAAPGNDGGRDGAVMAANKVMPSTMSAAAANRPSGVTGYTSP